MDEDRLFCMLHTCMHDKHTILKYWQVPNHRWEQADGSFLDRGQCVFTTANRICSFVPMHHHESQVIKPIKQHTPQWGSDPTRWGHHSLSAAWSRICPHQTHTWNGKAMVFFFSCDLHSVWSVSESRTPSPSACLRSARTARPPPGDSLFTHARATVDGSEGERHPVEFISPRERRIAIHMPVCTGQIPMTPPTSSS